MDILLTHPDILTIPWISIGWFLGASYTTFKMYQLFVDPYTGTPPGPIKLIINAGLIITIPIFCFLVWPVLLGTILMSENSTEHSDSNTDE
jgi:hypothetical protein